MLNFSMQTVGQRSFSCLLDIYVEWKWVSTSLTVTTIKVKGTLDREHLLFSRGTQKQCTLFPVDLVVRHVMALLGMSFFFSTSRSFIFWLYE